MKLKLLSPFVIRGFDLNAARILQDPHGYEAAWDAVRREVAPPAPAPAAVGTGAADAGAAGAAPRSGLGLRAPGIDADEVKACRFTHASAFARRVGSRYRTIDAHSLPRALHALELEVEPGADLVEAWLLAYSDGPVSRAALEAAREGAPLRGLVRVHDHGIALLEVDLPVPDLVWGAARRGPAGSASGAGTTSAGDTLDTLQQVGISFAEAFVDHLASTVLDPLFDWLREQPSLRGRYLRVERSPGVDDASTTASRALWVTRSLVFTEADPDAPEARNRIIHHWLKDVVDDERAQSCLERADGHSTRWLNYLFREGVAAGHGGYPPRGWRQASVVTFGGTRGDPREGTVGEAPPERARPFAPEWDAMIITQYYYAAFDHLQSRISRILAISVAGDGTRKVSTVKALLDGAVRQAHMLELEFEENRKYYAHRVGAEVDEILDGWGFDDGLRQQVDRRLADCDQRLGEIHSRAMERGSVYTDLILLAIGIVAIFQIPLSLAEYGRAMTTDPNLYVYDQSSAWNVVGWLGASTTDALLIAGLVLSAGLTLLYAWFRTSRSRV